MGKDLAERHPEARAVYERADAALAPLGCPSRGSLSRDGRGAAADGGDAAGDPDPFDRGVEILKARGVAVSVTAGHSLGEYSALVAAGALTLEDAVVLVRRRGLFMQEAVPAGEGAMSAVIGLGPGGGGRGVRRSRRSRGRDVRPGELQRARADRHRGDGRRRREGRGDP